MLKRALAVSAGRDARGKGVCEDEGDGVHQSAGPPASSAGPDAMVLDWCTETTSSFRKYLHVHLD